MGLKDAPESTLCCISMSVRASTSRVPPLVRDAEIACAESALALAVVQLPRRVVTARALVGVTPMAVALSTHAASRKRRPRKRRPAGHVRRLRGKRAGLVRCWSRCANRRAAASVRGCAGGPTSIKELPPGWVAACRQSLRTPRRGRDRVQRWRVMSGSPVGSSFLRPGDTRCGSAASSRPGCPRPGRRLPNAWAGR